MLDHSSMYSYVKRLTGAGLELVPSLKQRLLVVSSFAQGDVTQRVGAGGQLERRAQALAETAHPDAGDRSHFNLYISYRIQI